MMSNNELDKEISRLLAELEQLPPGDEKYSIILANLKGLYDLKGKSPLGRIDINIVAGIIGNFLITGMVLYHERFHVITTRAGSFWRRT